MKYYKNFYQIKSNQEIFEKLQDEVNSVGHYHLPYGKLDDIEKFSKKNNKKNIVVLGVGGSSLGLLAIYDFLRKKAKYEKSLHILDSTDPLELQAKLNNINLDDAFFVVISKSGVTIETISIFKYLSSLVDMNKNNCAVVSCKNTPLHKYALHNEIEFFEMSENVSGRFSVFSEVGIVPLSMIGVNVRMLLDGVKNKKEEFFNQGDFYHDIMQKARFMVENKNRFNINIVFSYSSLLEGFNKWYVQLWAESLGKENINGTKQSLAPIALLGPIDQHSFLQSIMQGVRDKSVTFILIDDFDSTLKIPANTLSGYESLSYVDGISFSSLINKQAQSTIHSIEELKDVPIDTITIKKVDEYSISSLMFSYQILTSAIGQFLQIDTYNQPGVQRGKEVLEEFLKRKN